VSLGGPEAVSGWCAEWVGCWAHSMRAGAGPGKRKSRAVAGCVSFFCSDRRGV